MNEPGGASEIVAVTRLNMHDTLRARLFNARTILITGEIDEEMAHEMTEELFVLGQDPGEVTLLITSYGGLADAGGAIIRAIRTAQRVGCVVTGEVRGYAMSMAALILQTCDVRFVAREDIVMVHGFTGMTVGDVRNTEADAQMTRRLTKIYSEFMAERNTSEDEKYHNPAYWRAVLEDSKPNYFFGEEALANGLVDSLIDG